MRATSCMGRSWSANVISIRTTWPGSHVPATTTAAPPSLRFRQCPRHACAALETTLHTATAASMRRRGYLRLCTMYCACILGSYYTLILGIEEVQEELRKQLANRMSLSDGHLTKIRNPRMCSFYPRKSNFGTFWPPSTGGGADRNLVQPLEDLV